MVQKAKSFRMAIVAGGAAALLLLTGCTPLTALGSLADNASTGHSSAASSERENPRATPTRSPEAGNAGGGSVDADVVAPARDFSPCTVLSVDEVSPLVGFEITSKRVTGTKDLPTCVLEGADGVSFVAVQWAPISVSLESFVRHLTDDLLDTVDGEDAVGVRGSAAAVGLIGRDDGKDYAAVVAQLGGGITEAMVVHPGIDSVEAPVRFLELMLARA